MTQGVHKACNINRRNVELGRADGGDGEDDNHYDDGEKKVAKGVAL
jgi:hypothetical protein